MKTILNVSNVSLKQFEDLEVVASAWRAQGKEAFFDVQGDKAFLIGESRHV